MGRRAAINILKDARDNFAGLGTRKAKIRLNRLAKTEPLAQAVRLALEAEDASTTGKKYGCGKWSSRSYNKKHVLIHELIVLCEQHEWVYGKHATQGWPPFIVYFDLPGVDQISFHMYLDRPANIPDYVKAWDGRTHSTFKKLEAAIKVLLKLGPAGLIKLPEPAVELSSVVGDFARLKHRVANLEAGEDVVVIRQVDEYRNPLVEIEYRGRRAYCHRDDLEIL